ncbi:hypothetical protein DVH24_039278 [Malus domestica]|uniref:Uncharacterized protein n=1 Tax=Malus domestica TaxID=3750 RepID=A0A498HY78_MALDO|nr:hypothetical protein DVH24_039278 [Malus domestica]
MLASNLPNNTFFPTQYVAISLSFHITCSVSQLQTAAVEAVNDRVFERNEICLGLPSKGSMAIDTLDLLKDCQLPVKHVNPRQYVAQNPQLFLGLPFRRIVQIFASSLPISSQFSNFQF